MMKQEVILTKRLTLKGHDSQVPLFADGHKREENKA